MKHNFKNGTLQLGKPWGVTLALTFLIILLGLSVGESLSRTEEVRQLLTAPSLGSKHRGLEEQISRLEAFASSREAIDCIFLGDSTVQTDFAPGAFEQAYEEQTGKKIECFNFGIGASTVASSAAMAKVIVDEFEPRLLIFGIHALNFTVSPDTEGATSLIETPWLRYKLGQLSPEGWLYEHSYLYRYNNILSPVVRLEVSYTDVKRKEQDNLPSGFYPIEGQSPIDFASPPDPDSDHPYDEHYFAELSHFKLLPANLEALDQIADLHSDKTSVLAVEMPLSKTFFYYFEEDEEEYQAFVREIRARLAAKSVVFWETTGQFSLPDQMWFNRNHLNRDGAQIFSRWFGKELGEAVKEGKFTFWSG